MVSEVQGAVSKNITSAGLNPCFSGGWSRSTPVVSEVCDMITVLILVLVEDGLGGDSTRLLGSQNFVLILVLVEDGLGGDSTRLLGSQNFVLILVLVEDGLGDSLVLPTIIFVNPVLILVLVEDGLGV